MRSVTLFGSLVMAGLAFGCGGGGSSPTAPKGSTTTTTGGGPASASVSVAEYSFTADTVTVKAGAAVIWTNNGTVAHTATADGGAWDSGQLSSPTGGGAYGGGSAGASYSTTFTSAGTYAYHCANHPTLMTGVVIVTP
jgi:plastocyanin